MITVYAISNEENEYMYDDEDSVGGFNYVKEIDYFTLLFEDEEVAIRESLPGDRIVKMMFSEQEFKERGLRAF